MFEIFIALLHIFNLTFYDIYGFDKVLHESSKTLFILQNDACDSSRFESFDKFTNQLQAHPAAFTEILHLKRFEISPGSKIKQIIILTRPHNEEQRKCIDFSIQWFFCGLKHQTRMVLMKGIPTNETILF